MKPIVKPPVNSPPELIRPTPEQVAAGPVPFVLNRPDRNILLIVARDTDGDPMELAWIMGAYDDRDFLTRTVPGTQSTTFSIEFPRDPALDGLTLYASVFDDLERTDLEFTLEVP